MEMSLKFFNFLLIFSTITKTASCYCYCTTDLCPKRTHTLCKYLNISENCKNYKKIPLTNRLKQYIVDIHNEIRNHVASGLETKGAISNLPPAANMALLQWDDELELIAQRWADQCPQMDNLKHDECKAVERFDLGQNMVLSSTKLDLDTDFVLFILNWYKQVQNMVSLDVDEFVGMNRGRNIIGLYTQLIWAKTLYVGCGISMYKDVEKPNMYLKFFVCNYGPRGNVVGESVYQKGPPCSKCSQGCSQDDRYKSLCKNDGMEINTEKKLFVTIRVNEVDEISKSHKPITKNRTPIQRPIVEPEKPLSIDEYLVIDEVWLKNKNQFVRRDPPGEDNEMCMCLIQLEN